MGWVKSLSRVLLLSMPLLLAEAAGPALAASAVSPTTLRAQQAGDDLAAGRFEKARTAFTELLATGDVTGDRRASLLNDRGVANWRLGDLAAAVEDFNGAIALVPEFAVAYNNRGNVLLALDQPKEAVKDFDRALLLAPNFVGAWNNRAIAQLQLKDRQAAVADFSRAAELAPGAAAPLNGRGRARLEMGQPYAALRDFNRAVAGEPAYRPGLRNRVQVLMDLHQYESAIQQANEALEAVPDDLQVLTLRARAYAKTRRPFGAIKDLNRVLELSPDSVAALTDRGGLFARLGEDTAAMKDLDRAMALDPRNATALAHRAVSLKPQPDIAAAEVARALALEPKNTTALRVRAEMAEAANRADQAIPDYRQIVAVDPSDFDASAALERLTGERRAPPVPVTVAALEGWQVFRGAGGRYYARNADFAKLEVPLEVTGDTVPELTDWTIRKDYKGIGVLRYIAGKTAAAAGKAAAKPAAEDTAAAVRPARSDEAKAGKGVRAKLRAKAAAEGQPVRQDAPDEIEMAVVVDLWRSEVRGIEPWRHGTVLASWAWNGDGRLAVKGTEGANTLALRQMRDPAPAPARVATAAGGYVRNTSPARTLSQGRSGGGGYAAPPPRRTVARRDPPRKVRQKSLFDLLFSF